MIARTWNGRASADHADAYLEHLRAAVLPELRAIDGFAGMQVTRREDGDDFVFTVCTLWSSMTAIRRFAGEDSTIAVVLPAARALLTDFDPDVRHAEVVLSDTGARPGAV